ncbi:MAG: calcineurin-like phosphoesterase C-terminal domain-containing protein [Bacteroidia bacterium]
MNVKSTFILGLLCCLLVSFKPKSAIHLILKGKVEDENGKAITGVMVTDGTNCVFTNASGKYLLESTNEAQFVYITVPSGYEIPVLDHLAKFYVEIPQTSKASFTANFKLSKLKQDDKHHFTVLWADPQINNQDHADKLHQQVVTDTRSHVAELLKIAPVTGISAGDISWDEPKMIAEYKKAVHATGIPFFQVLGNHDMDINTRSDEKSDHTFKKSFGPSWYSFNRGNAHYIVLDNVFYYNNTYNYLGYITEKQFKWLEQDLKAVKPGVPVFVSMHISAYTNEKSREQKEEDNQGKITFNRNYLYELLKPYQAHLLTGHTHYNENIIENGIYEHIHAAVCSAWWTGPVCEDGTPGGYGVYEVNGDKVSWYYKSLGETRDFQMKVYGLGIYKDRPKSITANVWNWDPQWIVRWYEDGKEMGGMKQITDFDADAIKYLNASDKNTWMKARLTDHLFTATPSLEAKVVKIEVVDRFGTVYIKEIKI